MKIGRAKRDWMSLSVAERLSLIGKAIDEAAKVPWPPPWEPPWPPQGLLCPRRPCGASGLDDWRRWAEHVEDEGRRLHSELLGARRDLEQARQKATRAKVSEAKHPERPIWGLLSPELSPERWPASKPRKRRRVSAHDADVQRALVIKAEAKRPMSYGVAFNAALNERGAHALHGNRLRTAVNRMSKVLRKHR